MNRGSSASASRRETPSWASMRPRFMNRGSHRGSAGHPRDGTRFNEAPIHESGKFRPLCSIMQAS